MRSELLTEPALLSLATPVLQRDPQLVAQADANALRRLPEEAWRHQEQLLGMAKRELRVLRDLEWTREVGDGNRRRGSISIYNISIYLYNNGNRRFGGF